MHTPHIFLIVYYIVTFLILCVNGRLMLESKRLKNAEEKTKPSVGGKCPKPSTIQTELHCAAMLSLWPSYG